MFAARGTVIALVLKEVTIAAITGAITVTDWNR